MKHLLKIIIATLLLSAVAFLVIDLQAPAEQSGFVLPAAMLAILTGVGLIEIDRRLVALESAETTSDEV